MMRFIALAGGVAMTLALFVANDASHADEAAPVEPRIVLPNGYEGVDGKALYSVICQSCHMVDGAGAVGAGFYPALASNERLEDPGYAIMLVVNGYKAMPSFGRQLNDEQIAAILTYVRTNFGNDYADPVNPEDVKVIRP